MSRKTAFIEMETLNQMKVINYRINECMSNDTSIQKLITNIRKSIIIAMDKQQTILEDAVMTQAKDIDLSKMETWGKKKTSKIKQINCKNIS